MASYTINITVDPLLGNFTFSPTSLRVARGDSITLVCLNPFEAEFKGRSPGNSLYLSNSSPTLTIPTNADLGTYHYAVAVAVVGHGTHPVTQVFIDADCGQINVQM